MPTCARCKEQYRGEPNYCDICDEYRRQVRREEFGIICGHCGKVFMPGGFDKHRWQVYYRTHDFPTGKRQRLMP